MTIDVNVMVELISKIHDLPHNESYELLAHSVNSINIVNFMVALPHGVKP